jgi:predicted cobalt transporter CbtA
MIAQAREAPLGVVMRAALVAGLLAGLVAAAFHFFFTEPFIERAIVLETLRHQAEGTYEEPMVSRGAQQVGLFVGFLVYGLTWSLLFGGIYHVVQRWMPAWSTPKRGLLLAGLSYWAVALLPSLKYPANPPGIGDPDTITYRQILYVSLLGLSVAGTAVAVGLGRALQRGVWPILGLLGLVSAAMYVLLPANPDRVELPADLLAFRALSLGGLTLFWGVLGLVFGLLLRRQTEPRATVQQPASRPARTGFRIARRAGKASGRSG